jgi:hypothetical protein
MHSTKGKRFCESVPGARRHMNLTVGHTALQTNPPWRIERRFELNRFKEILDGKQAELETIARNRDGIVIEESPHALDEVKHTAERDQARTELAVAHIHCGVKAFR